MRNEEISSDNDSLDQPQIPLSHPEKQMYDIQILFFSQLKEEMESIKVDTHKLLLSLTDTESRNRKKIPYTTFRSFEAVVKRGRKLKEFIMGENKKYEYTIESREEVKKQNNSVFRLHLKSLHDKKQELKQNINILQRQIQELEDSGSLPYVDFYTKIPLNMDMRITYNTKILLSRVELRSQICDKIYHQFTEYSKIRNQNKQQEHINFRNSLQLLFSKELLIYRRFRDGLIGLCLNKKKQQVRMQKLKVGVKKQRQQIDRIEREEEMKRKNSKITQTDHFIYLKQLHRELQKMMEGLPLDEYPKVKRKNISKSAPK